MNQPVRGWAGADAHAADLEPGRLDPFGIGRHGERRHQQNAGGTGDELAAG